MSEEKLAKLVEPYLGKSISIKFDTWVSDSDDNQESFGYLSDHKKYCQQIWLDGIVTELENNQKKEKRAYLVGHDEVYDYIIAGSSSHDYWNMKAIESIFCGEIDLKEILPFLIHSASIKAERNSDNINQFLLPEYLNKNNLKQIIAK